jgi:hypothetical protein
MFGDLVPGSYTVTFVLPSGKKFTPNDKGTDDKDSDANTTTGAAPTVTLVSGENNPTIDAGIYTPAKLGDYVWEDKNANGIQEAGELPIGSVAVTLTGTDGVGNPVTKNTTTDATGMYMFGDLAPGKYVVTFASPIGFKPTFQDKGGDDTKDSDANPTTGKSQEVTLISGDNNPTIDAGFYRPAKLGDFVFDDKNGNGIQEAGEPGVQGVTVNLTGTDGGGNAVTKTILTDATGMYMFGDLVPGSYTVTFVLPSGKKFTPNDKGTDDKDSDANTTTGVAR